METTQLSREAALIQGYQTWVAPATLLFSLIMAFVTWVYPDPMMVLLTTLIFITGGLQGLAYRMAGEDRVELAVWLQISGVWSLSAALSFAGLPTYSISIGLAVMPVIIAVPYVSPRTLARMAVIPVAIAAWGGLLLVIGAPLPIRSVPAAIIYGVVCFGVTVTIAFCTLSLWYTRRTLDEASAVIERTHLALRSSEEELERKVAGRAAELEASQGKLRRARDEALAANQHKSAFLANMSHELRTPLNAIIGFSEVLGERVFGDLGDKQAEYITDVHQSGRHLLSLINDILDLSKIEAGRMDLAKGHVDLAMTVSDTLTAQSESASERGVDLRNQLDGLGEAIEADPRRIRQVFDNLIANAIKYTPEGGSVTVSYRVEADAVEIQVADTGIGIAAENQALIFEAFRQVVPGSGRYAHAQDGTGVGLALTRRLVELHGGSVWVESEPRIGSTFHVRMPRGSASAVAGEAQ